MRKENAHSLLIALYITRVLILVHPFLLVTVFSLDHTQVIRSFLYLLAGMVWTWLPNKSTFIVTSN